MRLKPKKIIFENNLDDIFNYIFLIYFNLAEMQYYSKI